MLSRFMTPKEQLILIALACSLCVGALAMYVRQHDKPPEAPRPAAITPSLEPGVQPSVPDLSTPAVANTPEPTGKPPERENSPEWVTVCVAGEVEYPDTYVFAPGDRIQDAIERAGGITERGHLRDINRAAHLADGTTLTIPHDSVAETRQGVLIMRRGQLAAALNPPEYTLSGWKTAQAAPLAATSSDSSLARTGGGLIDLNHASEQELQEIPGIGPKLAAQVVQYRMATPFRTVDDLTNVSGIGPKRLETMRPFVSVEQ